MAQAHQGPCVRAERRMRQHLDAICAPPALTANPGAPVVLGGRKFLPGEEESYARSPANRSMDLCHWLLHRRLTRYASEMSVTPGQLAAPHTH